MLCASASLFDSRILNCENLICRGIEEVITGLTRNQFVDNTTRGFESLPLRQRFNLTHSGWIEPFFLAQREEMNLFRFCDKRFAYRRHKLTLRKRAFAVSASRRSTLLSFELQWNAYNVFSTSSIPLPLRQKRP